ncbi:MAG: helix-turn-helix domain-containing protein [Lachnospiraceae bacterium]
MPYEILLQHASIVSCLCAFGISQSSLGRIMAQENLPSLITLEKICTALGVTLSQFFQEGNSENLTEKQKEVLRIWNNLSTNEQETVMSMLRGLLEVEE